jgi:hypothetical protein
VAKKEKPEKKKKKHVNVKEEAEPEYDLDRQPLWVTDQSFDATFQLTGEGRDGQRAYLYGKKEFVVIANKDWEKEDKTLPGKSIRMTMAAADQFCKQYLKELYGYDLKLEE